MFKLLRSYMVRHGDTQTSLASYLLVSYTTINHKFNGHCPWTLTEMYAIMDRYHIPYADMHKVFPKGGRTYEA